MAMRILKERKILGYDVVTEFIRSQDPLRDREKGESMSVKITRFGNTFYDVKYYSIKDKEDFNSIPLYVRKIIKGRLDIFPNTLFKHCTGCSATEVYLGGDRHYLNWWEADENLGALICNCYYDGRKKWILKNNCLEGYWVSKNEDGSEDLYQMFAKNSLQSYAQYYMRFVADFIP